MIKAKKPSKKELAKIDYRTITTWEKFCKATGTPVKAPFSLSMLPKSLRVFLMANYQLAMILAFFRFLSGEKLNYLDGNQQYKYEEWLWKIDANKRFPSGFGLSVPYACSDREYSSVGSWLCSLKREHHEHVMKHFKKLFVDKNIVTKEIF